MSLGPVMLDISGQVLDSEDRDILLHPAVGGVILFSRNFASPEQLAELTRAIHALREPHLVIGVDQEGGRVQRFREGFVRLPPAAAIGAWHRRDRARARQACESLSWLMASELRSVGVDFSFAPVLDLDRGLNSVIGDRAFSGRPHEVAELGAACLRGVRRAGMAAVAKHFPGHGGVREDSHLELPIDPRPYAEIAAEDLIPFRRLIAEAVEGIMPAHVRYPSVDRWPAGFSRIWLHEILRDRLGFQGVIFSDDLNMGAAASAGDYADRAHAALQAGCDMIVICNNRPAALAMLEALLDHRDPAAALRLLRMHGRRGVERAQLREQGEWHHATQLAARLCDLKEPELDLADPTLSETPPHET